MMTGILLDEANQRIAGIQPSVKARIDMRIGPVRVRNWGSRVDHLLPIVLLVASG